MRSPVRSDRNYNNFKPQFHKSGAGLTSVGSWCWLFLPLSHPGWPAVNRSPGSCRFLTWDEEILWLSEYHCSLLYSPLILSPGLTVLSIFLCSCDPSHHCVSTRVSAKTEPGPAPGRAQTRALHGPWPVSAQAHLGPTWQYTGRGKWMKNATQHWVSPPSRLSCIRYFSSAVIVFVFAPRHLVFLPLLKVSEPMSSQKKTNECRQILICKGMPGLGLAMWCRCVSFSSWIILTGFSK